MALELDPEFQFGNGRKCCAKPVGCTVTARGCMYLRHPWKRAVVFHDQTVPCQKTSYPDLVFMRCTLLNDHSGTCAMVPVTPSAPEEGS